MMHLGQVSDLHGRFMEIELMVTKRDNRQPTTDRVNIEQYASGRWTGRVLQKLHQKVMIDENVLTEIKHQDAPNLKVIPIM